MALRHGGQILADQLKLRGVARVFSVPGESFLAALDGLHDSGIANIVCRQEGGAAMMAEAHAKLTGTPGILFVTRGPGATNASSGIHVSMQDSTPMIVFVGQIDRRHRDRDAFQEVDYRRFFTPIAKWAAEIEDTSRIPEYVARAWTVAQSGRPGPVVLALPEDMLSGHADVPDILPAPVPRVAARPEDAQSIAAFLAGARKPLVVLGGSHWSEDAAQDAARFAEGFDLPVAVTFRRQSHIDNESPYYAGDLGVGSNPKMYARLREADTLLLIGTRFGDIPTGGYELMDPAAPGKRIAMVHPSGDEIGRLWQPEIGLVCDPVSMVAQLAQLPRPNGTPPWAGWRARARDDWEAWQLPADLPGEVRLSDITRTLRDLVGDDAIITNGAGNYAATMQRHYRFRRFLTHLGPTSGSMGYGFPAAIAASLEHPERDVIAFAGDGCFQMTCNEMSTAIQHGATPITIVANNGMYGTIRMHQERHYPARVSGTAMANPDFAAFARAYGGHGEVVERNADFADAFARARASGLPAVIELRLDPEALTSSKTLSAVRAEGEAARQG